MPGLAPALYEIFNDGTWWVLWIIAVLLGLKIAVSSHDTGSKLVGVAIMVGGMAGGITLLQAWPIVLLIVFIVIAILVAAIIGIIVLAVYETGEKQTKENAVESGFLEKMKIGLKHLVDTFGGDIRKAVVGTKESIFARMKGQSKKDPGN